MKIRSRNRKWILHYSRLGRGNENFGTGNASNGFWPEGENSSVQAFAENESNGRIVGCRNQQDINRMVAGKKIHGINVEMWAQDRAAGVLSKAELLEYCNEVPGLFEEVERRKWDFV